MIRRERHRMLLMATVELAFLVALGLFFWGMQSRLSTVTQTREMDQRMDQLRMSLITAEYNTQADADFFDSQYAACATATAYAIYHDVVAVTDSALWEFRQLLEVTNVLVLDRSGRCLASAFPSPADFTGARFNQLRTVFRTVRGARNTEGDAVDWQVETTQPFGVRFNDSTAYRYYAARIDENRLAVIEQDAAMLDEMVDDVTVWNRLLSSVNMGRSGYCFVVTKRDGVFRYHPDESCIGRDAFAAGVDPSALADGACLWLTVYGERLYCGVVESDDCFVLCAVPEEEFHAFNTTTVTVILFCFFVVITAVIAYSLLLQTAQTRRCAHGEADDRRCVTVLGFAYDLNKLRRLAAGSMIGLMFLFGAAYYMQTLFSLSSASMSNASRLQGIVDLVDTYQTDVDRLTGQYSENNRVKCQVAAHILQARPDLVTDAELHELSAALDTQYIAVFDGSGTIVATDSGYKGFHLSQEAGDQSYEFWRLLQGVDYFVQDPGVDDVGIYRQYAGYALRDAANVPNGFVQLAADIDMLWDAIRTMDWSNTMINLRAGREGFAFAVNRDDGTFWYYPKDRLGGTDAVSAGLPAALLCDNGTGYATLSGVDYFLSSTEASYYDSMKDPPGLTNLYLYIALPRSELSEACLPLVLATVGLSLGCLLVVLLLSFELDSPRLQRLDPIPPAAPAPGGEAAGPAEGPARQTRKVGLWARQMWRNARHPEKTVVRLLVVLLSVLALCVTVSQLFADRLYANSSVLHFLLAGNWQHGVNIFAVTGCLLLMCKLYTAALLCTLVLRMLTVITSARGRTVCLLLGNVIKYALVLAGLYYCLSLLGVDTATLLASAGIVTVILGLGAQSLVNDILAGLFIIFEGEFQVGDIVTIGDWRGTVVSVGLRTTRVENSYGDIKSITNHTVTSSINMTQKPSIAQVDMLVPAAYPLSAVEPVLEANLPAIAKQLPAIEAGPRYRGVVAVTNLGTTLRFTARCAERDRSQLTRDMARAIRLLLEREPGIAMLPAAGMPAARPGANAAAAAVARPADRLAESAAEKPAGEPAGQPEEKPTAAAAQ